MEKTLRIVSSGGMCYNIVTGAIVSCRILCFNNIVRISTGISGSCKIL